MVITEEYFCIILKLFVLEFFLVYVCSKYVDMKRLSSRFQADVFIKRLLQHGHEF